MWLALHCCHCAIVALYSDWKMADGHIQQWWKKDVASLTLLPLQLSLIVRWKIFRFSNKLSGQSWCKLTTIILRFLLPWRGRNAWRTWEWIWLASHCCHCAIVHLLWWNNLQVFKILWKKFRKKNWWPSLMIMISNTIPDFKYLEKINENMANGHIQYGWKKDVASLTMLPLCNVQMKIIFRFLLNY